MLFALCEALLPNDDRGADLSSGVEGACFEVEEDEMRFVRRPRTDGAMQWVLVIENADRQAVYPRLLP